MCGTNHFDGQISTPAYLLNVDGSARSRPSIVAAPTATEPGAGIAVTTDRPVSRFSLVRAGAATHTIDNDQRRIPLTITGTSGTAYQLAIPADTGVVLPGDYLLFAIDSLGAPSITAAVNIR
ncbi:galactose oxidase early set domain-containing protein [Nocardia sp. NPDC046763]|uniref:galactose oxidase early set domain-containing protein n=1 Tax=Nocardia sp. NPDC046763 TaxID=3155256 RepID=UPI0033F40948